MATTRYSSGEADGASAIGHTFDTVATLSNSGAKIASWKNATSEKAYLDKDGKLFINSADSSKRYASSMKEAADAAAADATAEHGFFQAPTALTVTAVYYLPDAALTADDTNFATLTVSRRSTSGGSKVQVAQAATTTGGTGNWVAFDSESLGTITNAALAVGEVLTWEIAKSGTGVVVPSGTLQIEYSLG